MTCLTDVGAYNLSQSSLNQQVIAVVVCVALQSVVRVHIPVNSGSVDSVIDKAMLHCTLCPWHDGLV